MKAFLSFAWFELIIIPLTSLQTLQKTRDEWKSNKKYERKTNENGATVTLKLSGRRRRKVGWVEEKDTRHLELTICSGCCWTRNRYENNAVSMNTLNRHSKDTDLDLLWFESTNVIFWCWTLKTTVRRTKTTVKENQDCDFYFPSASLLSSSLVDVVSSRCSSVAFWSPSQPDYQNDEWSLWLNIDLDSMAH